MITPTVTEQVQAAVDAAQARGHLIEEDSPGGPSRVQRWSCTTCGHAVLRYGDVVYGGLVDDSRTCDEVMDWYRSKGYAR